MTATLTAGWLEDIAAYINQMKVNGHEVLVNGEVVKGRALTWGTGSMSVQVQARTTRGTRDDWYKPGQRVPVIKVDGLIVVL